MTITDWMAAWRRERRVLQRDLDELDAALGELRAAGWPAPTPITEGWPEGEARP